MTIPVKPSDFRMLQDAHFADADAAHFRWTSEAGAPIGVDRSPGKLRFAARAVPGARVSCPTDHG